VILGILVVAAPGLLLFGFVEWCLHWFNIHMNPGQVWSLAGMFALGLGGTIYRQTRSWLATLRVYAIIGVGCLLVIGLLTSTFRSCREPMHAILPPEQMKAGQ